MDEHDRRIKEQAEHEHLQEIGQNTYDCIVEEVRELRRWQEWVPSLERMDSEFVDKAQERLEQAETTIQEGVLSVETRGDWAPTGHPHDSLPTDYRILLGTGGPAVRMIGELDRYQEPKTAVLQAQDWFTPWVDFEGADEEVLLDFARCFYFGG
jgi:hypothetical protein